MTIFKPITPQDLARYPGQWHTYEHLLELEFAGTTSAQAYELVFSRLLKPDPLHFFAPETGDTLMMVGTDQREHFVPRVASALKGLAPGASLLDLGCGDGQTTLLVLADRKDPLRIVPLDPNKAYLERYRALCAQALPEVTIPYWLEGPMDELMESTRHEEHYDAIISLHSLHFAEDPRHLLGQGLDLLKPGGRWPLVVIAEQGGFANAMLRGYLDTYGLDPEGRTAARHASLDALLSLSESQPDPAALTQRLSSALGRDDFVVEAIEPQATRIYGHDFGDLVVVGLITGMLSADDDRARQIRYVSHRLQREADAFDLRVDLSGPRKRMLSFAQPQVFLELRRL